MQSQKSFIAAAALTFVLSLNIGSVAIAQDRTTPTEKLALTQAPGYRLEIRNDDELYIVNSKKLAVRIAANFRGLPSLEETQVIDDVLYIQGVDRAIDLRNFEGEFYVIGNTNELRVVKSPSASGTAYNVPLEIDRAYPDLVALERLRIKRGEAKISNKPMSVSAKDVISILRGRKSAKILGRSGIGKSELIKEIVYGVAHGKFKNIPRTFQIREIKPNALASGTQYVGAIETKMDLIYAYNEHINTGWVVDEASQLAGLGVSEGNPTNIGQSMLPVLENGSFRMIAISTSTKWNNAFGNDTEWNERFEPVVMEEPSGVALEKVIESAMANKGYAVPSLEIIQKAVELSNQFEIEGGQPRKAVNLLLKTQMIANGNSFTNKPMQMKHLEKAAVAKYRVDPVFFEPGKVFDMISSLREGLDQAIVGNEQIKDEFQRLWFLKFTNVGEEGRIPLVILYGPPGVGKTFSAETSANLLKYDTVTIEMNKYKTLNDVEAFRYEIYLKLAESSNTVFVLDELEKAAKEVQDSLLQMIQSGTFTVNFHSNGNHVFKEVQMRPAVFVATTNAGSALAESPKTRAILGYQKGLTSTTAVGNPSDEVVYETLARDGISRPLMSRASVILPTKRPTTEQFKYALEKKLKSSLAYESKKKNFKIELKNEAQWINDAMKSFSEGVSDYRMVDDLIKERLMPLVAQAVIERVYTQSPKVTLVWNEAVTNLSLPMKGSCEFILHARQK